MAIDKNNLPGCDGEHNLQTRYGTGEKAQGFYEREVYTYITQQMKEYIAKQKMMFIATADKHGECDSSFRSAKKDFVFVLDKQRVVYPEFNGNGVMASLGNISENPHIGLLFVDFFENQVGLHINGKAHFLDEGNLRNSFSEDESTRIVNFGKTLELEVVTWVVVEVEEAYIHCSKHIPLLSEIDS
ncbi:MAG: pyridoxamine 5'-phosphate oxidase family protein [Sulfurimonas sp.]|nr:pyridoxamine 5'-phosphate oxidase family protein [Sulfurimonas sp.]PHQ92522.1 MAG: pyridoxamine 5-phosphate oxidase [Sulfurimonas sp.]